MKKIILSALGGLAVFALFALASQTYAAIASNGGFELGTAPGTFSTILSGDSTSITDWTVNSGSVDYIGTYWQASDGSRSIDLNGNEAGSISQTFATTAGATYDVNFHLSGNPDLGPSAKVVRVSASGGSPASGDFTYDTAVKGNTKADMKWESDDFSFVASGASTTLTFASQVSGAAGPALDNVSITETAPATRNITASAGANGSISPSGLIVVNYAANQSFTITANSGFHVSDVLVDGSSVGAVSTYTFTNVTADHTIAASFAVNPVGPFTITASAGANGAISPSGAVSVASGANQSFTITANSGFHVSDVMVDSVSVGAVSAYTFNNVIANHTISATFAADTVTNGPKDKDECKNDGWKNFHDPSFKNQGQCVSFANHQNKNDDEDDNDDEAEVHSSLHLNTSGISAQAHLRGDDDQGEDD